MGGHEYYMIIIVPRYSISDVELVHHELLGVGRHVGLLLGHRPFVDVGVGGHVLVLAEQLVDLEFLAVLEVLLGVDGVVEVGLERGQLLVSNG